MAFFRAGAVWACVFATTTAAACGDGSPASNSKPPPRPAAAESKIRLPEYHGLYAVEGGAPIELKGERDPVFCGPEVEFILFHRGVTQSAGEWKMIGAAYDGGAKRLNRLDPLECRTKPMKDHPEMIRIVPAKALLPGAYFLVGTGPWGASKGQVLIGLEGPLADAVQEARSALQRKDWDRAADRAGFVLDVRRDEEMRKAQREAQDGKRRAEHDHWAGLAVKARENGNWDVAVQMAEKALRVDPYGKEMRQLVLEAEIRKPLEAARDALAKADFDAAADRLGEALKRDPEHAEARALRAELTQKAKASPHYYGRLYRPVRTLNSHTEFVHSLALSPDGKTLASGGEDGQLILWDMPEGTPKSKLASEGAAIRSVAWGPDGSCLAMARNDGVIVMLDTAAGKTTHRMQGHKSRVLSVAFSPDGKMLASASEDRTVRLWDPAAGKERGTLQGHSDAVQAITFHADGKMLASAGHDGTVRLWDLSGPKEMAVLNGHAGRVYALAFSPDRKTLASGGGDMTVKIWDCAERVERRTLKGPGAAGFFTAAAVVALAFTPDGQTLACGLAHDTHGVFFWDVGAARLLQAAPADRRSGADVLSLTFSRDGKTLISEGHGGPIHLWGVSEK